MPHTPHNHYTVMFFIMLLAGFLSTMNVWADKLDDVRFSLNDVYMTLLMTGWMFFFMGLYYKDITIALLGTTLVVLNIWCIRTQFMITDAQFKLGMIPHHSMAVHMSRRLLEKDTSLQKFARAIIKTQEAEIQFMKQ